MDASELPTSDHSMLPRAGLGPGARPRPRAGHGRQGARGPGRRGAGRGRGQRRGQPVAAGGGRGGGEGRGRAEDLEAALAGARERLAGLEARAAAGRLADLRRRAVGVARRAGPGRRRGAGRHRPARRGVPRLGGRGAGAGPPARRAGRPRGGRGRPRVGAGTLPGRLPARAAPGARPAAPDRRGGPAPARHRPGSQVAGPAGGGRPRRGGAVAPHASISDGDRRTMPRAADPSWPRGRATRGGEGGPMLVAGVDGVRGGWLLAFRDGPEVDLKRAATVADVVRLADRAEIVAIDMPIGLLEAAVPGGRECDRLARRMLGPGRGSCVFPPPCRPALGAATYAEAVRRNRASASHGLGIVRQAYRAVPEVARGRRGPDPGTARAARRGPSRGVLHRPARHDGPGWPGGAALAAQEDARGSAAAGRAAPAGGVRGSRTSSRKVALGAKAERRSRRLRRRLVPENATKDAGRVPRCRLRTPRASHGNLALRYRRASCLPAVRGLARLG